MIISAQTRMTDAKLLHSMLHLVVPQGTLRRQGIKKDFDIEFVRFFKEGTYDRLIKKNASKLVREIKNSTEDKRVVRNALQTVVRIAKG